MLSNIQGFAVGCNFLHNISHVQIQSWPVMMGSLMVCNVHCIGMDIFSLICAGGHRIEPNLMKCQEGWMPGTGASFKRHIEKYTTVLFAFSVKILTGDNGEFACVDSSYKFTL